MKTIFKTLLVCTTLYAGFGKSTSNAQIGAAGGVTMGAGLSIGMEKAQEIVRKAKSAGNDVLLQAGLSVQNTIAATEAAYARSLNKTIDSLQGSELKAYTDVDNLLAKAMQDAKQLSNQVTQEAKIIVAGLPFAGKFPQVAGVSPSYVNPDDSTYCLAVDGMFRYASNKKHRPELEFNGKRFQVVEATSTSLKFVIPGNEFGSALPNQMLFKGAVLHVPWDSSGMLNPFSNFQDGAFPLQLGKLPSTPGILVISHEVETTRDETDTRRSGSFNFDSHADDIEENRSLELSNADYDAGWRIVPHSGYFILDKHNEGDEGHDWYNKGLQQENDRTVIWRVRTEHKGLGSSGKIIWGIGAKVTRVVHEKVQQPDTVALQWGMRKVFPYPAGKWKATWKRFDGKELEYRETDLESSLFKLSANADSITVLTYGL